MRHEQDDKKQYMSEAEFKNGCSAFHPSLLGGNAVIDAVKPPGIRNVGEEYPFLTFWPKWAGELSSDVGVGEFVVGA